MNKRKVSIVAWLDVRDIIIKMTKHYNQRSEYNLVEIIDSISIEDLPDLIQIDYLYGDIIINNGVLQIPTSKHLARSGLIVNGLVVDNDFNHQKIIEALAYAKIPLFLSLENANEVFINTGTRIIPLNLFKAGSLLGLFETVNYIFEQNNIAAVWSVSAGSRSIFTLPKISDELGLKKLRKYYAIPNTIRLKNLTEQFELFKSIASSDNFSQPWVNKVLFFTSKWMSKSFLKKYPQFKEYLMYHFWQQTQFALNKVEASLLWEKFSEATAIKRLNPSTFLTNQAKHILNVAYGNLPAFIPSSKDQTEAPVLGLQTAIMEVYLMNKYMPIIMNIGNLANLYQSIPIYYSLSYHIIFEGSPLNYRSSTIIEDTRNLKYLIDTFFKYLAMQSLNSKLINHIKFEYIHIMNDPNKDLLSSHAIANCKDFMAYQVQFPNMDFPYASYFWNGCIRITNY